MAITFIFGLIFSFGLGISGMCVSSNITEFLSFPLFPTPWNFRLLLILGGALAIALPCFQIFTKVLKRPLLLQSSKPFPLPPSTIDFNIIFGPALFGIGWGLCGICPGPAVLLIGAGYTKICFLFLPSLIVGMKVALTMKEIMDPKIKKA